MSARTHQHRMSSWLWRLFAVLSLVASCEAQAAVESVSPQWSWCSGVVTPCFPTLAEAALDSCRVWDDGLITLTYTDCVEDDEIGMGSCIMTETAYTCLVKDIKFPYPCLEYGNKIIAGPKVIPWRAKLVCPTPTVNSSVPYSYNNYTKMCERDVPDQCALPNVIDPITHKCGPPPPPPCTAIDPIPPLPEPKDDKDYACTQSLDKGKGNDVDNACPPLKPINPKLPGEMACLAKKLNSLSPPIPYNGPSSTIRTKAYQQHLLEIWDASKKIKKLTPAKKQVCADVIADVAAQMEHHGIKFEPSDQEEAAPHVQGIAFDIPKSVAEALVERATMTRIKPIIQANYPSCIVCMHIPLVTGDVQDYISSSVVHPPACNLKWGGSFGDNVHFQLP